MELSASTTVAYLDLVFTQMLHVADRLGDERVNERPLGPQTNAVAALIFHCCQVSEFWLGHVALGRSADDRDRNAEFSHTATVAELHDVVDATRQQVAQDVARIDAGEAQPGSPLRLSLPGADESNAAAAVHVLEELFQHLGHMELAADALLAPNATA